MAVLHGASGLDVRQASFQDYEAATGKEDDQHG
jgi:hypothetical protein